jgi:excisionase family DNA binding protein
MTAETHFTESGASPPALDAELGRQQKSLSAGRSGAHNARPSAGDYLTSQQVADLLQIDEKTVSRWSLKDPTMPVFRRGRVVRFQRERLMAWLERQEPRSARRAAQAQRKDAGGAV